MNENLSQLKFHEAIDKQIRILNKLLSACAGTELFDNPDVEFYLPWCSQDFLRFRHARPHNNSVELEFYFQQDGLRIDLEGYPEAWETSFTRIKEDEPGMMCVLERLITCPILMEYKGNAKFVNLFNSDGSRYAIWALQSTSALLFRGYWKSQFIDQHLFAPIYPRSMPVTQGPSVRSTRP